MAVFLNAKGTSQPNFQIGHPSSGAPSIRTGTVDPSIAPLAGVNGDLYLQFGNTTNALYQYVLGTWKLASDTQPKMGVAYKVIDYTSTTTDIISLPANAIILSTEVEITTAFNGVGATLDIGYAGNIGALLPNSLIDLTADGNDKSEDAQTISSAQTIISTLASNGSTQGAVTIYIVYSSTTFSVMPTEATVVADIPARDALIPLQGQFAWVLSTSTLYVWTGSVWAAASGGGSGVTSVATGTGLTGGPITSTGTISLASIANNDLLANTSGSAAAPTAHTLTSLIDSAIGNTQGDILYRNSTGWVTLAPSTSGYVLSTNGASANPSWVAQSGGLSPISNNDLLANISGSSATPTATSVTALLDSTFSTTHGAVIYRNGTTWVALAPGTSGQVLTTAGTSGDPSWQNSTGGVTSVNSQTGAITFQSTGSTVAITNPSAGVINLEAAAGTSFPLLAPNGSASAPSYSFSSHTTSGMISFYEQDSGDTYALGMVQNDAIQMSVSSPHVGTAVNYVRVIGSATGASPTIMAFGSDTTGNGIDLTLSGKPTNLYSPADQGGGVNIIGCDGPGTGAANVRGGSVNIIAGHGGVNGSGSANYGGSIILTAGSGGSNYSPGGNIQLLNGYVGVNTSSPGYNLDVNGPVNASEYFVAGSQIAASNLSNGTTGSGNIVLASSPSISTPTISNPTVTGTLSASVISASSTISASNFSGSSSGTNTGDQTITLTGAVTGSGTGSFSTSLATVANNEILANISGSTASPSAHTLSNVIDSAVGDTTQGDILFRGAAGWTYLAPGTSGEFLQTGGTGANPVWNGVAGATGGTVTAVTAGTGLTGGTINTTGTIAIDSTVVTLTGAQTLTNKSIAATQLTGTLQAAQAPTLTGDVTSSAGSFATTVAKINGATLGTTTATSGNVLVGSGSAWQSVAMSGDATINSTGAISVTKINGVALGLGTATATSGNILVGDGTDWESVAMSGDATLLSTGAISVTKTGGTSFGTMATQNANSVAITGGTITGMSTPVADSDVATKRYVDLASASLNIHTPCDVATTGSLSATYAAGTLGADGGHGVGATLTTAVSTLTLDTSYTVANTDRVLVKDQADAKQNGIYVVSGVGSTIVLTRASDYDNHLNATDVDEGDFVIVENGATYAHTAFIETAVNPIVIGTNNIAFTQFSGAMPNMTFTGDVTGSGAGTVALTLATVNSNITGPYNSVTVNAKGLVTAASVVSASANLDTIAFTQGDILYRNASAWVALPPGTSGQFLQTSGTGANPVWSGVTGATGGTVTSVTFTGDGTLLSSTPSSAVTTTGTVTATLASAGAKTLLGNTSSSSAAPTYTTSPVVSGTMTANSFTGAGTGLTGTASSLSIGGNAATVTTNANLTGNVTSVGNATTIASLPAISGANLTNLTAANISAGTAGINISGNAATVTTNANLTGPVTSSGNATSFAAIASYDLLANNTGSSAAPSAVTLPALMNNVFGSTAGEVLYNNGSTWTALAPGSNGQVLTTTPAGLPAWSLMGLSSQTFVAGTNFTAGSSTTLTLNYQPVNAASLMVFCDGVYQSQTTYSLSNETITFSQAIAIGTNLIECVFMNSWSKYNATYLMVAGGGGGGGDNTGGGGGGGGGAGGYLTGTTTLNVGSLYTVVVGTGGAGSSTSASYGGTGGNTTVTTLTTALGGGGGAGAQQTNQGSGGSGGGASTSGGPGGSGTAGQGFAGGTDSGNQAGGGGGASQVGSNGAGAVGGSGGAGLLFSPTGTYYAGGGGGGGNTGGTAGTGGGGAGASSGLGGSGTANTGGGGGGCGVGGGTGGHGGSGVAIFVIPTTFYSGKVTGSPTVTTSGANTIITFTSSGSYTA